MDIRDKLMNSSEKYTLIPVHALADDVADFACEVSELTKFGRDKLGSIVCLIFRTVQTLLVSFARSNTTNAELWVRLKKSMISAHRWPQPLNQWVVSFDAIQIYTTYYPSAYPSNFSSETNAFADKNLIASTL
jgi:hypothetical protein